MNLGPPEIAVILLVALLVFGPSRLPELSRQIGGAMRELRRMQGTLRRELDNAMRDDPKSAPNSTGTASTAPAAPARSEPDHTDLPAPPAETPDDGFAGPRDSFL